MQVHFFVLNGSPQPFGKNVIECSSFPIHADLHFCGLKKLPVLRTGKMASLVAIANGRRRLSQSAFECCQDKR